MSAVDELLAACAPAERALLEHVRDVVHDEVPGLVEVTSYRLPAFALGEGSSKLVVGGLAAGRRFLSWYPFSGQTIPTLADELAGFETTKGSVHFTVAHPLGDDLLRRLLQVRLAEVRAGH